MIVSYWESDGFTGNYIPEGSALDLYGDTPWQGNSARMITETLGGQDPVADLHRLQTFKSALITRQRIVTEADVLALCQAELGAAAAKIELSPSVEIGPGPKSGLRRILELRITPTEDQTPTSWDYLKQKLESQLNLESTTLLPIRVVLTHDKPE
ncbi:MAG: hypothetical protein AAF804_21680 [Bacteroidota bacterium]